MKLFGIKEEFATVQLIESEVVSGECSVVFWRDKVGGSMLGRCERHATGATPSEAILGYETALVAEIESEAQRMERLKDRMCAVAALLRQHQEPSR